EPGGLMVGRGDGELHEIAGLISHAAVIAGHDAEAVVARLEIRILRLAVIDDLLPVRVLVLQLVAKMDFLRRDEAQRREMYRDVADQSRKAPSMRCIPNLAIGLHFLNVYRRREVVHGKVMWIDDTDAGARHKQQS